jgi:hypothetical protein
MAERKDWRDRVPGWLFALMGLVFLVHGIYELLNHEWLAGVMDALLGAFVVLFGLGKWNADRADAASNRDAMRGK